MSLLRVLPFRVLLLLASGLLATDIAVATTSGHSSRPATQHLASTDFSVSIPDQADEIRQIHLAASRGYVRPSLHPQHHPQVVHVTCWNGKVVVEHPHVQDCPNRPAPTPPVSASASSAGIPAVWIALKNCEAGAYGWTANTGNGYYGAFQIAGTRADLMSPAQQLALARKILSSQGVGAWPVCGPRVGLYPGA